MKCAKRKNRPVRRGRKALCALVPEILAGSVLQFSDDLPPHSAASTFFFFVKNASRHTDLKCDTTDWKVATILQHVEVFCHQCCTVDQTVCGFSMVAPLTVFPCHVLEPRQTQVGRILVALCNPKKTERRYWSRDTSLLWAGLINVDHITCT